jgi:hypothetical protein
MSTLIQIVTASAIILAADSKMVDTYSNTLGHVTKIVSLSPTVAVAGCDLFKADATVTDDSFSPPRIYELNYNFVDWAKQFADFSDPIEATNSIAEGARKTFANFGFLIAAKAFRKRSFLAEYYVAGYTAQSIPLIFKISIPIDWENAKILDPQIQTIFPVSNTRHLTGFVGAGCTHNAIDRVFRKDGEPYKRATMLQATLFDKLFAQQDLTIDEAQRLATALVTVEAEFTPNTVGLPAKTVVIAKPSTPLK